MKFTTPYDTNLSKNKKNIGTNRFTRQIIQSKAYKDAKQFVFLQCKNALMNETFKPKTKTKIKIMFYRPDYRSDIQNFLEAICDAIKIAINVGDNYYVFDLDYQNDKLNPRIEIEISQ
jgi:Holliday junction resolvase RusA-like endonuclease